MNYHLYLAAPGCMGLARVPAGDASWAAILAQMGITTTGNLTDDHSNIDSDRKD
jgi:hypothetical protein